MASVYEKIKSKVGRSKVIERCEVANDGKKHCERVKVNPNGSEVVLASFTYSMDGQCRIVEHEHDEQVTGELQKLQNHVLGRDVKKCRATPPDY